MKPYRGTLLASVALLAALPLFGCGDAKNGGSGSYIRVESISPSLFEPDVDRTICKISATGEPTYEANNVKNQYASVTFVNQSAPTTPTGQSTASYVTLTNYRGRFSGVSRAVSLPDLNMGGWSTGVPADGTAKMNVLVMDLPTLAIIRDRYVAPGSSEELTLRATITVTGKDAFDNTVTTDVQVTIVVADYSACT
jgi:hypothetical protein